MIFSGSWRAARVRGDAVVLGVDRLCVDDRALAAELIDERMVARGEVDVVACVRGRPSNACPSCRTDP